MKLVLSTLMLFSLISPLHAAEKSEVQTPAPDHGVRSIGLIFESDLGEADFADLLKVTKGKVFNLKELKLEGEKLKTTGGRLITLQPKKIAGKNAIEVKVRTFTGLAPEPAKVKELVEKAEKTVPFTSSEEYQKQTQSEESAGKVFETYSVSDPIAPERCFSAPNGVLSMKDIYGREMAGTSYQCNDWIRRVERVYDVYCRRHWEPNRGLSTFGCHCIY